MLFFAHCVIDPEKRGKIEGLRPEHLKYISKHRSMVHYGGVAGTKDFAYSRICLFLNLSSEEEARNFVLNDPYHLIYSKVEIFNFDQKIPTGNPPP